jgi:hypothetical protein
MIKVNITDLECTKCGAYLYPPREVSDVGVEQYEDVIDARLEVDYIPTVRDLEEINRLRDGSRWPKLASIDDWISERKEFLLKFREVKRQEAQRRFEELKGKLQDLELVEEPHAFKIRGRRSLAVLELLERGWRLRCPFCETQLAECRW